MAVSLPDLREIFGWSQSDLAKHLGVAQSTVCRMENGQQPSGAVEKLINQLRASVVGVRRADPPSPVPNQRPGSA